VTCDRCGQALEIGEWPFCPHGFPLHGVSVIDDQLEGGPRRFETMGDDAPYIESKSQWRREMHLRNLECVGDKHSPDYYRRRFRRHDEELRDLGKNVEY
jgi:hypothetical protein